MARRNGNKWALRNKGWSYVAVPITGSNEEVSWHRTKKEANDYIKELCPFLR